MDQENNLSSNKLSNFLDISWGTILKISVAVIFIYFLYLIKDLIIWFIFALVLSILFEPAIGFLTKKRIPRFLAVSLIYILVFGVIGFVFYLATPFFISEFKNFSESFPQQVPILFERISPIFERVGINAFESFDIFLANFQKPFEEMARNIFNVLIVFFGGIFAAFFTISMAFFLSLEKGFVEKILALFFPEKYENYLLGLWERSREKVIGWFLMRIIGVIFVGLSTYIAFLILGVNYPVSLAAIAGIFDFVPIVGPLVAAMILFITVALDSFLKAVFVIAVFALIGAIENNVLFPLLSRRIIRVPPIIVLVGLFIGGKLWGVAGAVIMVPLLAILFEFLKDFFREKKDEIFLGFSSEK